MELWEQETQKVVTTNEALFFERVTASEWRTRHSLFHFFLACYFFPGATGFAQKEGLLVVYRSHYLSFTITRYYRCL